MKTLIAIVFGMVLWQLIINILVSRYQDKLAKMKKGKIKFNDENGTTYIKAEKFDIEVPDNYEVYCEGNKIMIRKKNDEDVQ